MKNNLLFGSIILISILIVIWSSSYIKNTIILKELTPTNIERPISPQGMFSELFIDYENKQFNILLLGISGENYISGNLTDTIILASIHKEKSIANMFSIPRDLWVSDEFENFSYLDKQGSPPTEGWQKINEFYKLGGGKEKPDIKNSNIIKNKIEQITGQKIHRTVIINLKGIKEIIDIIGGVETEEEKMNGEEALFFIQDRSRPGSDFSRMLRQQKLIIAIKEKLFNNNTLDKNPEKIAELFEIGQKNISTDIGFLELLEFNSFIRNIQKEDIGLYAITTAQDSFLYSNLTNVAGKKIYTLHPNVGYENYSEIQNFINKILNNDNNNVTNK